MGCDVLYLWEGLYVAQFCNNYGSLCKSVQFTFTTLFYVNIFICVHMQSERERKGMNKWNAYIFLTRLVQRFGFLFHLIQREGINGQHFICDAKVNKEFSLFLLTLERNLLHIFSVFLRPKYMFVFSFWCACGCYNFLRIEMHSLKQICFIADYPKNEFGKDKCSDTNLMMYLQIERVFMLVFNNLYFQ